MENSLPLSLKMVQKIYERAREGLRALRDDYAQHEGEPKALQEIFRAHDLFVSSYRNLSKARRDLGMLAFDLSDDYEELDDWANMLRMDAPDELQYDAQNAEDNDGTAQAILHPSAALDAFEVAKLNVLIVNATLGYGIDFAHKYPPSASLLSEAQALRKKLDAAYEDALRSYAAAGKSPHSLQESYIWTIEEVQKNLTAFARLIDSAEENS